MEAPPEQSGDDHGEREWSPASAWALLVGGLALCSAGFWFELSRALGGNELSWAYVSEWPLLAVFGTYMWWKMGRRAPHVKVTARRAATVAPEHEDMLKAWQAHQRDLFHLAPEHEDPPS